MRRSRIGSIAALSLVCLVASCKKDHEASSAKATKAQASAPSPEAAQEKTGHVSGVRYADEKSCDELSPCTCVGTLEYGENGLKKIGITLEHLKKGTPCVFADFDQNGVEDIAFVDPIYGQKDKLSSVQVLLFDSRGLRDIQLLPKQVKKLSVLRTPKSASLFDPEDETKAMYVYANGRFGLVPRPNP